MPATSASPEPSTRMQKSTLKKYLFMYTLPVVSFYFLYLVCLNFYFHVFVISNNVLFNLVINSIYIFSTYSHLASFISSIRAPHEHHEQDNKVVVALQLISERETPPPGFQAIEKTSDGGGFPNTQTCESKMHFCVHSVLNN